MVDNFDDIDSEEYFESFEEILTPDDEKKASEELDNISQKCFNIRQEINKPHKCSKACPCKVINIELDLLNAHISKARSHLHASKK